jgi:hypothetical protein
MPLLVPGTRNPAGQSHQENFQPSLCVTVRRSLARRRAAFVERLSRSTTIEHTYVISVLT